MTVKMRDRVRPRCHPRGRRCPLGLRAWRVVSGPPKRRLLPSMPVREAGDQRRHRALRVLATAAQALGARAGRPPRIWALPARWPWCSLPYGSASGASHLPALCQLRQLPGVLSPSVPSCLTHPTSDCPKAWAGKHSLLPPPSCCIFFLSICQYMCVLFTCN